MPPRKKLRLEHSTDQNDSTPRRKSSRSTAGQSSGAPLLSSSSAAAALHHQDPTPLLPDPVPQTQDTDESDSTTTSSNTGFLSLPPELRLMIYGFALDQKMDQKIRAISFPVWKNYSLCRRIPAKLQMSLGNLANTCKIVALEVRDFRAKQGNRSAAIQYSTKRNKLGDSLHIAYLQRAPCPVRDLTELEITINIKPRLVQQTLVQNETIVSSIESALSRMFGDRHKHFAHFLDDATKLESLRIWVSTEIAPNDPRSLPSRAGLEMVVRSLADMMSERIVRPHRTARLLRNRNMRFLSCGLKHN